MQNNKEHTEYPDYSSSRKEALKLVQKLRAYWCTLGYEPQFTIQAEACHKGIPLFSIRSDINLNGEYRMNKVKSK